MKGEYNQIIYIVIGIAMVISVIAVINDGFSLFNILRGPFVVIGIIVGLCIAWYSTVAINKMLKKIGLKDY
ncbi:hypothetical protein FMJ40_08160 [Klebsiella variicola]|uniref:hypothetical protein n=1 Tax=Klebsiella variicola TaxID=244366 RepID=UPI001CCBF9D5|nr:hypothetical protein [Klebsiella variicola]MBZ6547269.1 hypothetical protein [Klebsiella variicola]MBZ6575527.1 hypothetical protein [Klebsiella variicola]MBZ7582448.1 hypothetical protein [Klebsiella variicola]